MLAPYQKHIALSFFVENLLAIVYIHIKLNHYIFSTSRKVTFLSYVWSITVFSRHQHSVP